MGIDIPCSHRCALGATFCPCPNLDLHLTKQWNELKIDFNILEPQTGTNVLDEMSYSKKYASNVIKRYSGYKKMDEIEKYVEDNLVLEDEESYISGIEVSIINIIYRGISIFTQKKMQTKPADQKHDSSKD